jgi:outer membrane murein-binding lipoprotein Lpp
MFRSARMLIVAAVVAVSLLGSASVASADTIGTSVKTPLSARIIEKLPTTARDISWE